MTAEKQNGGTSSTSPTPWIPLQEVSQIEEIKNKSQEVAVVIFKHSTRCSISAMARDRLERGYDATQVEGVPFYFLDLIAFREVSNAIAEEFAVMHQSPQVLVVKAGQSVYDNSHMGITFSELAAAATVQ